MHRTLPGLALGLLLGLILGPGTVPKATGAIPAAANLEIRYLLDYLGASGCEFYRNGSWYGARVAEDHLRGKYLWMVARERIRTAEEFIEQAATRSSVSGEPYAVRCAPAAPTSSSRWLREQLDRYRGAAALGAPRPGRGAPLLDHGH